MAAQVKSNTPGDVNRVDKRNFSDVSVSSTATSPLCKELKVCGSESVQALKEVFEKPLHDEKDILSVHEKLDKILNKLSATEISNNLEFCHLKEENKHLKLRVQQAEGKSSRLENKLKYLEDKLENVEMHYMQSNLVFYNLPESHEEDSFTVVSNFIVKVMKVPENLLYSPINPGADIHIDIAYRIGYKQPGGKFNNKSPRPMVVKFVTMKGRNIILSKSSTLHKTKFAISEQLPSHMRQRRNAQVPILKSLRAEAHDQDKKISIKLIKDKLIVDNELYPDPFEVKPLDSAFTDSVVDFKNMVHSNIKEAKKSYFQGHFYPVHSMEEAKSALNALMQDQFSAGCDQIMYAYRIQDLDGDVICGQSDDKEYEGSKVLKALLQKNELSNGILMVCRKHLGPNLGNLRFKLIEEVANECLASAV